MPIKEMIAKGIMMPSHMLDQCITAYPLSIDFARHKALVPISGMPGSRRRNRGGTKARNAWYRRAGIFKETTITRSSVSKFFRRLGFASFKAFRKEFSEFLMFYQLKAAREAAEGPSKEQQEHLNRAYKTAGRTVSKLKTAASMIRKSQHVVMIGDLDDLLPFFDLQISLIGSYIPAYFCRSYDISGIPAHLLHDNVLIISVDDTGVYDKDIKELQKKTSAKLIAFGFDKTATTDADLYIRLPSRMMKYEISDALSMVSEVLLNEFLKAKKLR